MADEVLKIVESPFIADVTLPLPVQFNGLDQPVLPNYVQNNALPGGLTDILQQQGYLPAVSPITALSGTTPTINLNSGANRIFEITLSGNTTYSISNDVAGAVFIVRVKQGSGTTYTNTWFSTVTWITFGATAPVQTTTTNGITTYGFVVRTAGSVYDGYRLGTQ